MSRLEIWAAVPTPFDEDGRLDLSVIPAQAEHLVTSGADGAFLTGTTGEFSAMTSDERRRVVEAWSRERPDGFGLAAHVGSTDLAQATDLAKHAADHGIDFIASVAPYYGEAPTIELVVSHVAAVAAAAPDTPFCYYHIPSMTGSTHRPSEVVRAAGQRIPTLHSVKFTDDNLLEFERTANAHPGIRLYFGRDELLPAGLAVGATAVIGSLYNGLTPVARRVAEAFDRGEPKVAYELHRPFRDIVDVSGPHGGLGFVKELMNKLGPDAGHPRSPWGPLAPSDLAQTDTVLPILREALSEATAARSTS